MQYDVLHPNTWFDPRDVELTTLDELYKRVPRRDEYATEAAAVAAVRAVYPDAIAMPCPVVVNNSRMIVLGILDKYRQVDPDYGIDFALVVVARATNDTDRHVLKKGNVGNIFHMKVWKPPVVRPELAQKMSVELRGTDLDLPVPVMADVGHYQGRLAIRAEIDGVAISLVFDDKTIRLVSSSSSEVPIKMTIDGDGSGQPGSGEPPAA